MENTTLSYHTHQRLTINVFPPAVRSLVVEIVRTKPQNPWLSYFTVTTKYQPETKNRNAL